MLPMDCSEYKDLVTIFSHPGFERLDLPLDCTSLIFWVETSGPCFRTADFTEMQSDCNISASQPT